jgi:hypothetical protein
MNGDGFEQARQLAFLSDMKRRVVDKCIEAASGGTDALFRVEAFTEVFLDYLQEYGQVSDTEICCVDARAGRSAVRVNAWGVDADGGRLELVATIFHDSFTTSTISAKDIETSIRQAAASVNAAVDGAHRQMEPSAPVFDMFQRIAEVASTLDCVRVVVLVDGIARKPDLPPFDSAGVPVQWDIWDYERLHRVVSVGLPYESLPIDIEQRLGESLPCLKAPGDDGDYQCYMAVLPGDLLHDLYQDFGPRLLELNVRSFLQARGKVNKGIRDTLLSDPGKFLAYNNGLSITAEEIDVGTRPDGQIGIRSLKGFQIVNGGQTVASVHRAKARDGVDLRTVAVQAKITILRPELADSLVSKISRFANTQNRVNEADFSANHPFHVRLQQLSETTWTPGEQSRWFYERARGQYEVAKRPPRYLVWADAIRRGGSLRSSLPAIM